MNKTATAWKILILLRSIPTTTSQLENQQSVIKELVVFQQVFFFFCLIIIPVNKTWIMKRKWKAMIGIFNPSVWISLRDEKKVENIYSFHIKTSFAPTISALVQEYPQILTQIFLHGASKIGLFPLIYIILPLLLQLILLTYEMPQN